MESIAPDRLSITIPAPKAQAQGMSGKRGSKFTIIPGLWQLLKTAWWTGQGCCTQELSVIWLPIQDMQRQFHYTPRYVKETFTRPHHLKKSSRQSIATDWGSASFLWFEPQSWVVNIKHMHIRVSLNNMTIIVEKKASQFEIEGSLEEFEWEEGEEEMMLI